MMKACGRAYPGFIDADWSKKPLNPSCLRYADAPYAFYLNPDSHDKQVLSEEKLFIGRYRYSKKICSGY